MDANRDKDLIEEIVDWHVDNKFKNDGRNVEGYKSVIRKNINIEKELESEYNRLVEKWMHLLNSDNKCSTVMILPSQEKVHTAEEVKAATPI